jgi:hypothetical protein
MEEKINSEKNNHIFPKKFYQNPFKEDIVYKSNKMKTKKISKIKKDNFIINSNLKRKLSQISIEKDIMKQSLKHDMSNSNSNIMNLNETNYLNKNEKKFVNSSISIDFKKNSAVIKHLTDINNNGDKSQESRIIFNKNKGKNIFHMKSKLICNKSSRNKNYKLINNISNKINTESTININTNKLLRYFNKSNLQNFHCTKYKKLNLNINFSNKIVKNKRWLKENVLHQNKKNNKKINNDNNNLRKNNKIYKSDANILINNEEDKNKLKNNKNLEKSIHKKVQSLNINNNKMNKESNQRIVHATKKSTEDIIKSFNYTILANSKSANTKPTNISSFVISEKKIEQDNNAKNKNCKIIEKSPLKSSNLKEHMKFINLNSNEIKILFLDNHNKTKESDSKFLNYELGQTNGLSITDSLFYSLENSYKDEKDKNKIIEYEHSIEYMEKIANEILNSNKNLEHVQKNKKNKKEKDSYCDLTDNNMSILNEFPNGESIHRIINYQINVKK